MEDYRAWLQARKDIEQTVLSNVFLVRNKFWDREHYIKRLVNCFQDMTEEALNYVPEFIWHPAASSRKKQHLRYIDEAKIVDFLRGVPITRQIDNSTFTFYEHDNIEVIDLYYAVG
jgi:hypothetical protein